MMDQNSNRIPQHGSHQRVDQSTFWDILRTGTDIERDHARTQLLNMHIGIVHGVARHLRGVIHDQADIDELVSAGTLGLMNALETYDPDRGISFLTFATQRIRGAILDDLRQGDTFSRPLRKKIKTLQHAQKTLLQKLSRPATDLELIEYLGIDADTLRLWNMSLAQLGGLSGQMPLEDIETDEASVHSDFIADDSIEEIDDAITHEQQVARIRKAIQQLKPQEQTILSLYYFENLKLAKIGEILDLTEGRVSQLRTRAIKRIQTTLGVRRQYVA